MKDQPLILFDGECNFCNSFIRFIINNEGSKKYFFASQNSTVGKEYMSNIQNSECINSIILFEHQKYYLESTAVLKIFRELRGVWKLVYILIIIPKPLRDLAYRYVAKRRKLIFKQTKTCIIPTEEIKERFLS